MGGLAALTIHTPPPPPPTHTHTHTQNDLSKPLSTENIDNGSGVLFPFWDEGTKMVYLCGKVSKSWVNFY